MSLSHAFLFYGPEVSNSRTFEAMSRQTSCVVLTPVEVMRPSARVRNILEMQDPFMMDVTGHSYAQIRHLHGLLENVGYRTHLCLQSHVRGSISESRIQDLTTQGLLQVSLPRCVVLESFHPAAEMLRYVNMILNESGPTVPLPGVSSPMGAPSEVYQSKVHHARDNQMAKQQQASEISKATPANAPRLKVNYAQDNLLTKQRQASELLQAKQRELIAKSR